MELEIVEFDQWDLGTVGWPFHDELGVDFYGSRVLCTYTQIYPSSASRATLNCRVTFRCLSLLNDREWVEDWTVQVSDLSAETAPKVRGKLRFGELLLRGLGNSLRLRRSKGDAIEVSFESGIQQVLPVWECGNVCWVLMDRNDRIFLVDENLKVVSSTRAPPTRPRYVAEGQARLLWSVSEGGVTLFLDGKLPCGSKLLCTHYAVAEKTFTTWESLRSPKDHFSILPTTDFVDVIFDATTNEASKWDPRSKTFRGLESRNSWLNAEDDACLFNRDFVATERKKIVKIEGLVFGSKLRLPNKSRLLGPIHLDRQERGTLWLWGQDRVTRFRIVDRAPSLLRLATDAYARICFSPIDCELWREQFASSVEKLAWTHKPKRHVVEETKGHETGLHWIHRITY